MDDPRVPPEAFPLAPELLKFIQLRECARINGKSHDAIIDTYRFCNVRREEDRVTKFIFQWLKSWTGNPMFVPNVVMARLFNNPDTLSEIGYLQSWSADWVKNTTDHMKAIGQRVFNPAYIVSTNGRAMDKVEYLCTEVLPAAFADPVKLDGADLDQLWYRLTTLNGVGSFMAAQVIADLKMFFPWAAYPDYWTFVAPGPGSMRGLNRLRGLEARAQKYNQKSFSMYIQPLRGIIEVGTGLQLCAQNTQNCLCEFDKYMRAKTGEGRPKQKYNKRID